MSRTKLAIFLVTILVFTSPVAQATSIVILRSHNRIFVGADSRRSYRTPQNSYATSVCKIVPAGRFWFVASGLTFANNQQVSDIGIEAGRSARTVEAALEAFRSRMSSYLPQAIAAQREVERGYSDSQRELLLEAAFLGFENRAATVSVEWFRVDRISAGGNVRTDRQVYSRAGGGQPDLIFLGKRQAIDRYLENGNPPIRTRRDATAFIGGMIQLEESESPETTAGPVDILELGLGSSRWLQHKAGCPAGPVAR